MKVASLRYDRQFATVRHYKRYPAMRPWVGPCYGKYYSRLLLIAESHYMPDGSTAHLDAARWYAGSEKQLSAEEIEWINTRDVLLAHHGENGIYGGPADVMFEKGIVPPSGSDNVYDHFCWYNYFQRPAEVPGSSIHIQEGDLLVAEEVFRNNLKIMKPEVVIFLSSKVWSYANVAIKELKGIPCDFVPHPSRPWWNRESAEYAMDGRKPLTGRQRFETLLKFVSKRKGD